MTRGEEFLRVTLPALDRIHALAARLLGNPHDAEDVVQETYLRAWRAWESDDRPRDADRWLATICLNLIRDRSALARVHREVPVDTDVEIAGDQDVAEQVETRQRRALVHRALTRLGEQQRVAIILMDLLGFTAAEVAELTDSPRGTVLARVHRGRKALARAVLCDREVDRARTRP